MKRSRAILDQSVELYDFGGVQAIDASGEEHVQACQHYAKHTDYTFEAVKTSLLVDCETSAILDILFEQTTTRQTGWFASANPEFGQADGCSGR